MRRATIVVCSLVAAVAAIGCSSSSNSTAPTTAVASGTSVTRTDDTAAPGTTPKGTTPKGTTPKGTTPKGTTPKGTTVGGSAFCDELTTANELSEATSGSSGNPSRAEVEAFVTQLEKVEAEAPDELQPSIETIRTTFEKIAVLSDDPAKVEEIFTLVLDPELIQASDELRTYARSECDIDLDIGSGASGSGSGSDTTDTTEDDPTSISAVRAAVVAEAGGAAWVEPVLEDSNWQYQGLGEKDHEWKIDLNRADGANPDVSAADAVEACTLLADYLQPLQTGSFRLVISDPDGTVLASKDDDAPCAEG